jgi:hypothetical protein
MRTVASEHRATSTALLLRDPGEAVDLQAPPDEKVRPDGRQELLPRPYRVRHIRLRAPSAVYPTYVQRS